MKDKIDDLRNKIKHLVDRFNKFEEVGVNREVLEIYIAHKLKLSKRSVKRMLDCQKEFFDNLIEDEMLKKI